MSFNEKIYFTSNTITLKQYENVEINSTTFFRKTTKPSVSKGSWYYELRHKSGSSKTVVGFCINGGYEISTTQENSEFSFYYTIGQTNRLQTTSLPVTEEEYTLGLGLDIDRRLFSIRYNTIDIKVYEFPEDFPNFEKWNLLLRSRGSDTTTNVYDINFGYEDFDYEVPYGFTPWAKNIQIVSCKTMIYKINLLLFLYINIIMK